MHPSPFPEANASAGWVQGGAHLGAGIPKDQVFTRADRGHLRDGWRTKKVLCPALRTGPTASNCGTWANTGRFWVSTEAGKATESGCSNQMRQYVVQSPVD